MNNANPIPPVIDALIEALEQNSLPSEFVQTYLDDTTSDRAEDVLIELYRREVFMLMIALSNDNVRQSKCGPFGRTILDSLIAKWAAKLNIPDHVPSKLDLSDYYAAFVHAGDISSPPTKTPFYAVAKVFANRTGLLDGGKDSILVLTEANIIGEKMLHYITTLLDLFA